MMIMMRPVSKLALLCLLAVGAAGCPTTVTVHATGGRAGGGGKDGAGGLGGKTTGTGGLAGQQAATGGTGAGVAGQGGGGASGAGGMMGSGGAAGVGGGLTAAAGAGVAGQGIAGAGLGGSASGASGGAAVGAGGRGGGGGAASGGTVGSGGMASGGVVGSGGAGGAGGAGMASGGIVGSGGVAAGGAGGASGGRGGTAGASAACAVPCGITAYCGDGTCKSRFMEFTVGAGSDPGYITSGPDGNLWFTTGYDTGGVAGGSIGRLTLTGTPTLFPILKTNPNNLTVSSLGIVRGPDDNIWFGARASDGKGYIGTMTVTGLVTNYQFSMSAPKLGRIEVGPNGDLWMPIQALSPSSGSNRIEVCSTHGSISEIALPDYSDPYDIVVAPDSTVWFTQTGVPHDVGRLKLPGTFTNFPTYSWGQNITVGPDGNIWFTEPLADINAIGRLTAVGTLLEFRLPTASSSPWDITKGPDGNVWFTEKAANNIGVITPGGGITEYPTPATPYGITLGPDGNIWFTEPAAGKVVRFLVP